MDKYKKGFESLLTDVLGLYFNGVLTQYGLDEDKTLEIVSNLTHISKERLVELKQIRDSEIAKAISQAQIINPNISQNEFSFYDIMQKETEANHYLKK